MIEHQDVAPANNPVELTLRHQVIWRKLCYSTARLDVHTPFFSTDVDTME